MAISKAQSRAAEVHKVAEERLKAFHEVQTVLWGLAERAGMAADLRARLAPR